MICECKFIGSEMFDIPSGASIKASSFWFSDENIDLCKYSNF